MQAKPFSQACENNKRPILRVLQRVFQSSTRVLEIGAGTGQHAVFFARALRHLLWQPSDQAVYLPGIHLWRNEYRGDNLASPIELDVRQQPWPAPFDAVFSANTAHIMAWELVLEMLENVGKLLPSDGAFALYGPFNYGGAFTSDSNAQFDQWLKQNDPAQGIRDFEKVSEFANDVGLNLLEDNPMPANNRLLVWRKS